jgi:putative tricarboxylic transport membrane protein
MINFAAASAAIALFTHTWAPWLVVVPGLIIGIVFGAIPGLSFPIAMALFLPFSLYLDFVPAILLLTAMFTGGNFGGALASILINVPGTPGSDATCFDGFPMTKQGRHNEALGVALFASVIGTGISYLILFFMIQPLSEAVLRIGAPEMLMIAIWGLTLIAFLDEGSFLKGLLAGTVGVVLGTVGMNSVGVLRGTFGSMHLIDGIPAVAGLIGLFAASELLHLFGQNFIIEDPGKRKVDVRKILWGAGYSLRRFKTILPGALIGTGVGALPGVGAAIANLVSYSAARARSKEPKTFGKGNPDGVAATEAANSSAEGGSMATLLALGVPGGGGTAVMLGAFAMHNVYGGPRFIVDHKDVVYAIILGNFVQVLVLVFVGLALLPFASAVVKMPLRYLAPGVLILCVFGAYPITGTIIGPIAVVIFGLIGWVMRHYDYPVTAMVIGLLLGRLIEGEMLRSFHLGSNNLWIIFQRPISLILFLCLAATLVYQMYRFFRDRKKVTG